MNENAVAEEVGVGGDGARGLSQLERVVNTFVAPTATFKDILRSTSWWLPFVLTVVAAPPVINSVAVSMSALVLQGSSGVPGADFYLLTSTNLATPMTNWTRLLTNAFDNNGNFDFTNLLYTNGPMGFFRLQTP